MLWLQLLQLIGCGEEPELPKQSTLMQESSQTNQYTFNPPMVWTYKFTQSNEFKKQQYSEPEIVKSNVLMAEVGVWEENQDKKSKSIHLQLSSIQSTAKFWPFYDADLNDSKNKDFSLIEGGIYGISIVSVRMLGVDARDNKTGKLTEKIRSYFTWMIAVDNLPYPPMRNHESRLDLSPPTPFQYPVEGTYSIGVFCWGASDAWPLPQDITKFDKNKIGELNKKPPRTSLQGNLCELWLVQTSENDITKLDTSSKSSYLLCTETKEHPLYCSLDDFFPINWKEDTDKSVIFEPKHSVSEYTNTKENPSTTTTEISPDAKDTKIRDVPTCTKVNVSQEHVTNRANEWLEVTKLGKVRALSDQIVFTPEQMSLQQCVELQIVLSAIKDVMQCKPRVQLPKGGKFPCNETDFSHLLEFPS